MGTARLYAAVAVGGFRRYATYRTATAAGVFTNTVFGLIMAYIFIALVILALAFELTYRMLKRRRARVVAR